MSNRCTPTVFSLFVESKKLLAAGERKRYTESVFNSMINPQSNLKNPLPSPHCCNKKQLSPDSDR
ncbi:MAG: hypothetical protein ACK5QJ_04575 [Microcystis sp.]|uniref:hypothetical protein n=1 Tax=Microcystis sp. TaxID=1127 RepID=UPI0022BE8AA3|nr:hypothetical protein [Microcystis sp. LE17-20D]MCZ8065427.1 hypothetical protein [Microcystis sp. LE17-20D]MCZ8161323.1 hypothetical protein [Microcystis sp. LE19-196.1B]MCZ8275920.1 hypothetical protein [Microcystis sp. LE19-4.1E]